MTMLSPLHRDDAAIHALRLRHQPLGHRANRVILFLAFALAAAIAGYLLGIASETVQELPGLLCQAEIRARM